MSLESLRTRSRDEDGQVLVLFALLLTIVLGGAAFTVDVGRAYFAQRALQASADASALAAAQGLPDTNQAIALATQYGGGDGAKNAVRSVAGNESVAAVCLSSGTPCASPDAVVVTESSTVSTIFGRVLGVDSMSVKVKAIACAGGGAAYLVDNHATACAGNGPGGGGSTGTTTAPATTTALAATTTTTAATTTTPTTTTTTATTTTTQTTTGQTTTTTPLAPPAPCNITYPFLSSNPLTSTIFSESTVLRAFAPAIATGSSDTIKAWYDDEHALTLGVNQVVVKTKTGTTTTNYPLAPLTSNPGSAFNPAVGWTGATDPTGRPMFPALFVTDITADPNSLAGDWQSGGTPIAPSAVFGTWKGAVVTIDQTRTPATTTTTPAADPQKNKWKLGAGSDTPPSGLTDEGYGAEARWNIAGLGLQSGHTYRMQFMVHDGDQNKSGGDAGEACMTVRMP